MIISHKNRFIFFKVRKTAGTSLEIALSSICGEDDVITPISLEDEIVREQLGYKKAQNYDINKNRYTLADKVSFSFFHKKIQFYNHIPARIAVKYIDEVQWNSYYKFCVERNPWDKVVSHYWHRGGNNKFGSINQYLKSKDFKLLKSFDLYSIDGNLAVDQVYKYEQLDYLLEDLTERFSLEKKLKLPLYIAKGKSRKDRRAYQEILSDKEINIIKQRFKREINLLNYNY